MKEVSSINITPSLKRIYLEYFIVSFLVLLFFSTKDNPFTPEDEGASSYVLVISLFFFWPIVRYTSSAITFFARMVILSMSRFRYFARASENSFYPAESKSLTLETPPYGSRYARRVVRSSIKDGLNVYFEAAYFFVRKFGIPTPSRVDFYAVYSAKLSGDKLAPHVYFDSKSHGKKAKIFFNEDQRYQFEGGVSDQFDSYVASEQRLETLSEITPDVLVKIMDAADYDIEIRADRVNLYAPLRGSSTNAQMQEMARLAKAIAGEVSKNLTATIADTSTKVPAFEAYKQREIQVQYPVVKVVLNTILGGGVLVWLLFTLDWSAKKESGDLAVAIVMLGSLFGLFFYRIYSLVIKTKKTN